MIPRALIIAILICACSGIFASPPPYKVESVGACTSSDVSDSMKGVLQEQGQRVTDDKGPLCEIWLRKSLPLKSGSSAAEYASLSTGELVGIIVFPSRGGDYRGQDIKPGAYTIRYQTMPSDGNHMGVSPTLDYVLLAPATMDKDPSKDIGYDALLDLSRKASGTNHPTPLYLVPPAGSGDASLRDAGDGHWALEMKTKAQAAGGAPVDFPLALVLIGKGEGG